MAEEPEKTWQWVTVDDYEKPAVPTTIKIKKWWKKFVRWVTPEQELLGITAAHSPGAYSAGHSAFCGFATDGCRASGFER